MVGNFYSKEVDYWGLGCLIFEMIFGDTAFRATTGKLADIKREILRGRFQFPQGIKLSDEAKDIIRKLICVDVKKRLGVNGIQEIKGHPWFASINWIDLQEKKVKSLIKIKVFDPTGINTEV